MPLNTVTPTAAEAAAREFVDMVIDESDWRETNYAPDHTATDEASPCDPTEYCGRCRPCQILAFLTKAWECPDSPQLSQHTTGAQEIDIAA